MKTKFGLVAVMFGLMSGGAFAADSLSVWNQDNLPTYSAIGVGEHTGQISNCETIATGNEVNSGTVDDARTQRTGTGAATSGQQP